MFSKELVLKIRKDIKENKWSGDRRERYLSYAFLRGRDYIQLERKINEDKFPENGRNSFLKSLVFSVAYYINKMLGNDMNSDDLKEIETQVKSWIFKKYEQVSEEAA